MHRPYSNDPADPAHPGWDFGPEQDFDPVDFYGYDPSMNPDPTTPPADRIDEADVAHAVAALRRIGCDGTADAILQVFGKGGAA